MFDFAHSNQAYVTAVINEIEDFLHKSFRQILKYLLGADEKNLKNESAD